MLESDEQGDAMSLIPLDEPVIFEPSEGLGHLAHRPPEPESQGGARTRDDAGDRQVGFCLANGLEHVPLRPSELGEVAVYPRELR